ncbi:translation initiation factor IF-2-like [Camelus ferus]|uniref:Translation initiation factor IF-2-like n=1 Tax=Camelus ferus TaxID=419612 RepID=A0A8B8SIZ6_CAMFR|nr:translation initiation factor IF-2-like [Camelus ferus]XP_032330188.1 translation initiation factor IF-2-like [Camelus ferus]XP_032330189.1 translation initiation factor IF-2-like [Camelus ferus]XP_032330190.1 translation initiation factor IF-2-like [Camelus ferus]XP_032330191.1 translation initiation factor IF-2-like [Camelus ferus]XP_032330192.1 translation initiation factor IF-2-like [Camelus ferus]XP_032330193.1 translation initiation factor IF-2-like [Camelus ferus]XP_032330194.1 tra
MCPQWFQSFLVPSPDGPRPCLGGGGKGELAAPRARVAATLLGNPPPQLSSAASRRRRPPLFKFSDAIVWETCSLGPARCPRVRDGPRAAASSPPPPLPPPAPSAGIPARSVLALASPGMPGGGAIGRPSPIDTPQVCPPQRRQEARRRGSGLRNRIRQPRPPPLTLCAGAGVYLFISVRLVLVAFRRLAILRHGGAFPFFPASAGLRSGWGRRRRAGSQPGPAERVKGTGRGSARGGREERGWGTRPSGNAAQRSLSEPRKKRKWQRKQGQIEPSSGISNELTRLGHSINTSSLMSVHVRVRAPRTRPRGARPARCPGLGSGGRSRAPASLANPGRRRGAAGVLGAALLPRMIPLPSAARGTRLEPELCSPAAVPSPGEISREGVCASGKPPKTPCSSKSEISFCSEVCPLRPPPPHT